MSVPGWELIEKLSEKREKGIRGGVQIIDIDDEPGQWTTSAPADQDIDGDQIESLREQRDSYGDVIEACLGVLRRFAKEGLGGGEQTFSEIILSDLKVSFKKVQSLGQDNQQAMREFLLILEGRLAILEAVRVEIYNWLSTDDSSQLTGEVRKSCSYVLEVYQLIIQLGKVPNIFILSKMLQFIENFSSEIRQDTQLGVRCIQFIFSLFDVECLRDDIANIYYSIAVEIKTPMAFDVYLVNLNFLKNGLTFLANY